MPWRFPLRATSIINAPSNWLRDWKLFRRLHPVALERFCRQVIEEINQATSQVAENFHERYLEVFRLIMDRNEEMGWAFNDVRRSKAIILLARSYVRQRETLNPRNLFSFQLPVL